MLEAIWHVLLKLAPWLLLGTAVAGLLHGLLPPRLVRTQLRGPWGVVKAVLVGVPMPLCSCGVIPAGLGLKRDGASDGASVGFLISTPQTGVDSVLVSSSFLGWPFALFKVASAAVTGVVGGWLADRFGTGRQAAAGLAEGGEAIESRDWRGMWDHSVMLLQSIWRWLVVGIVVSAAIEVLVPDAALAGLSDLGSGGAALVALAVSLPLYVCATASVPIAAALVAAGMPTGAALVFLMAGPATNVATIGVIYRGFGLRTLAVYLTTIVLGSMGFGMAFDFLLDSGEVAAAATEHHEGPVAVVSAVALVVILALLAGGDLRAWWARRKAARDDGKLHEIAVEGMTCQGCVSRLESTLRSVEGVSSAVVTLEPGLARVGGSIDLPRLRSVIEETGFRPG